MFFCCCRFSRPALLLCQPESKHDEAAATTTSTNTNNKKKKKKKKKEKRSHIGKECDGAGEKKKVLPGIEPGFRDSESPVITVTLQDLMVFFVPAAG